MDRLLRDDPILERSSHVYGDVRLYAPLGDPDVWSTQPWVLQTSKGGDSDGPIVEHLKAESVMDAWIRPSFVTGSMRFSKSG